ncbi:MAG: hypothetical protein IKB42_02720 [Clostridia bacterium]|nr:hypothetical protein [Clostridia bacterium]
MKEVLELLKKDNLKYKEPGVLTSAPGYDIGDSTMIYTEFGYFIWKYTQYYNTDGVDILDRRGSTDTICIYIAKCDIYVVYEFSFGFSRSISSFVSINGSTGKPFDVRNHYAWSEDYEYNFKEGVISDINKLILMKTNRQANLKTAISQEGALYGMSAHTDVAYNPDLLKKYSKLFAEFKEHMNEYAKYLKYYPFAENMANAEDFDDCLNNDDVEAFKKLNLDPNIYIGGEPLLHAAIRVNAVKIFDYLIKSKCDVNIVDLKYGGVALQYAVYSDHYKYLIDKLLKAGANINAIDFSSKTLIHDAIERKDDEVFDYVYNLPGLNKEFKKEPVMFEYEDNQIEKKLTKNSIQWAASWLNNHALEVMLKDKGSDVNNIVEGTYSPLVYVMITDIDGDKYEVLETLLKNGADPYWKEDTDFNPVSVDRVLNEKGDETLYSIINKYRK